MKQTAMLFAISVSALVGSLAGCGPTARVEADAALVCTAGQTRCELGAFQSCTNGAWQSTQECPNLCDSDLGCLECTPGARYCKDGNVFVCDAGGQSGQMVEACSGSNVCVEDACVDACEQAATDRSYLGCEYWAVDLDNAQEIVARAGTITCSVQGVTKTGMVNVCVDAGGATAGACDPGGTCPAGHTCRLENVCLLDAQHAPFAVVVSNPQGRSVDVTLTGAGGQAMTVPVAAGQVKALFPQMMNMPDKSVDGSGVATAAYKVTSTLPIIAYQFNPLHNVDVFSNDASLLVPRTAFDSDYYVMAAPTLNRRSPAPGTNSYHGFLAVVAWDDNTQVEVTLKAPSTLGTGQAAVPANTPTMFTLQKHQVLNLEAAGAGDLTGSRVRALNGKTVGVFGGHEAFLATEDRQCCADHLEEMIFPTSTWGKRFAMARSQPRAAENDVLRIMAQKPNTTIAFTPAPVAGSCGTLGAGEFCQVQIKGDTEIVASEPVLVGHLLKSVGATPDPVNKPNGDPSLALGVPVEQFRNSYTVLVPDQYSKNYIAIAAPVGGVVKLDGMNISGQLGAFGNNLRAGRVLVAAGQHKIECPNTCGILVHGYSRDVSYMFAGGLDLRKIVIE